MLESGVDTDTPPLSSAASAPALKPPAGVEPAPQHHKVDRLLSDAQLLAKHNANPARGALVVEVRRIIIDSFPGDPFSTFARKIALKMKTEPGRTQDQIRKGLSDQFRDLAGPKRNTIIAALLLAVSPATRYDTALAWTDQYAAAHPRVPEDELPNFVKILQRPEDYLTAEFLPSWITQNKQSARPASGHHAAVDDPLASALNETVGTVDPRLDAPRLEGAGDERHADEEDEAWLAPFLASLQRYQRITERPDPYLTDEDIDRTLTELARAYNTQPEVLEPAEDLARTTSHWQETARDQPVTVGLPLNARRTLIGALLLALLIVLICLGYTVISVMS